MSEKDHNEINISLNSDVGVKLLELIEKFAGYIVRPRNEKADYEEAIAVYKNNIKNDSNIPDSLKPVLIANTRKILKETENNTKIIEAALQYIKEDAKIDHVEQDWLTFFFERSKLVSDEAMQNIWGNILAEELNTPGLINRSLIHTLSIISRKQAESFCNICRFCWFGMNYDEDEEDIFPFIFYSSERSAYNQSNINWTKLKELEYLGLIQCAAEGFVLKGTREFRSGSIKIDVIANPTNDNVPIGNVKFTNDGRRLFDIVDTEYKKYRSDIFSFIEFQLSKNGCSVKAYNSVKRHI